ncbi:MAG: hypothetical protein PSX37_01290 [bacterium]|nr:hypothetical protein [bacterium]
MVAGKVNDVNIDGSDCHALAASVTPPPLRIIVGAEPMTDVDTTTCDMLEDLVTKLDAEGVYSASRSFC